MKMPSKALAVLDRRIEALVSRHYGCPAGIIGRVAGHRMARQHAVETVWTVSLLALALTDRVLEIGCGAGRALELVARQTPSGRVVGVDLSPTMVREARRRNAGAIRAGIVTVERGDVSHLPFADDQFDKVFSIHSVYFWPDRARALAELRRVLRPGGVLVSTVTTGKNEFDPSGSDWFQSFLNDQLLPEMAQAGFGGVSLEEGPDSRGWRIAAAVGVK
jgi:ubiquinone/menaquinone biosynthesis C-methylase UbiE